MTSRQAVIAWWVVVAMVLAALAVLALSVAAGVRPQWWGCYIWLGSNAAWVGASCLWRRAAVGWRKAATSWQEVVDFTQPPYDRRPR